MDKIHPGDIILFKFDKRYWYARPWAAIISWIIGSRYTHAAMIVDSSHGGVIIEAYYPQVRRILLENSFYDKQYYWEAWRPRLTTKLDREFAAKESLKYLSKPYDVSGLLSLAKEFILSGILGTTIRRDSKLKNKNSKWFCSELIERCYLDAEIELSKSKTKGAMAPSDFANKDRFELITTSLECRQQ